MEMVLTVFFGHVRPCLVVVRTKKNCSFLGYSFSLKPKHETVHVIRVLGYIMVYILTLSGHSWFEIWFTPLSVSQQVYKVVTTLKVTLRLRKGLESCPKTLQQYLLHDNRCSCTYRQEYVVLLDIRVFGCSVLGLVGKSKQTEHARKVPLLHIYRIN
jgi:hypothetical protein